MNLKNRSRLHFIWLIPLLVFASYAAAEDDGTIAWIEGRYFDVIGTDHRSVSFTSVLGETIAELCQRHLKVGSHDFPKRILATLYPRERSGFEKSYEIQVSARGQVNLNFRWDESLSFETMCFAFTEAYLSSYARFNYGVGADEQLRFWVFSALSSRNYLSLRPAQKTSFIRIARESEMPAIQSLFSKPLTEVADQETGRYHGYWVLQALRESALTHSQIAELLELSIAGASITNLVMEKLMLVDEEDPDSLLEEWWQGWLSNYLSQGHEFCDSLTTSSQWIEEMINFDAYQASKGTVEDLMELWDYRKEETLRSTLSARCEIIRLRMEQVNPAYFNAALSLGALYETVLEAENKHKFIRAVLFFLNDWEDTRRLQSRAEELIADCEGQ